jgi:hypothetical protein
MGNDHFPRQISLHIALKTMLVDSQRVHQHGLECNIEEDRPTGKRIDRGWQIENKAERDGPLKRKEEY